MDGLIKEGKLQQELEVEDEQVWLKCLVTSNKQSSLFVHTTFNGERVKWVYDTGCTSMGLSAISAEKWKLKVAGTSTITTANGDCEANKLCQLINGHPHLAHAVAGDQSLFGMAVLGDPATFMVKDNGQHYIIFKGPWEFRGTEADYVCENTITDEERCRLFNDYQSVNAQLRAKNLVKSRLATLLQ